MRNWLSIGAHGIWDTGGAWVALGCVLVAALVILLPSGRRRMLRGPVLGLLAFGGFFAISLALPPKARGVEWVRVGAFASLLLANARSVLLLVTETRPGRWLVPPIPKIIADIVQGLLYGVVLLATLHTAGFQPGELLTTSALLTAVLGLALQDTLGNLFSGLALQIGQPFAPGDWIELDGNARNAGRVLEVGWRATKLLTPDEIEVVIPNGVIAKSIVRNHTRPTRAERRSVAFNVSYQASPEAIRVAVLPALRAVPGVLADPAPDVVAADFADSAVAWQLRYWTDEQMTSAAVDGRVRERIWYALRRANLEIPYPQRDLHLSVRPPDAGAVAQAASLVRREAALGHVDLLDDLDPASRRALAEGSREAEYGAGEVIVGQGERGTDLFVLVRGEVVIEAGSPPVELARLLPGAFFGEMSFLTGDPRAATVRAATACAAVVVSQDALRAVIGGHPELVEHLGRILAERQLQLDALAARRPEALQERTNAVLERLRSFFSVGG